ncbi:MAG: stalk domain-containing protein [Paenibacillus macerans]|nr:stalk domain-containing protein [Paenibacillus macerans]
MTKRKRTITCMLAASLVLSASAEAAAAGTAQQGQAGADSRIAIELDGKPLVPEVPPVLVNGTVLVPIRDVFETLGAKPAWDGENKTVTAAKDGTTLVYRIGEREAQLNGHTLALAVPGQIADGHTLVPLRFVSEALGSEVEWDGAGRTVRIASAFDYDTTIKQSVYLRSKPDAEGNAVKLLPAGSKIHVAREVGAFWLEARTPDALSGYVSAKPKYTDYTSDALAEKQADKLIAYGKTFEGTPYEFGASPDQTNTFDCSSFVKHVFESVLSIELPRVSYDQAKEGKEVGENELRKGDLLFFSSRGLDIGHVGIYAGNNKILHTYSNEKGVHIGEFDGQWRKRFVTARRVF